jgi:ubiquinone/menaquinone biosynthesis C-methylase UbiE
MSHESVGQLQALNEIFAEIMVTFEPHRMAVLGCATGNGFEHIRLDVTDEVIAVDINPEYLDAVKRRYASGLPGLRLLCSDVADADIEPGTLDHVHAGLIFEYVKAGDLLERAAAWLKPAGVLSVVLQLESAESGPVTETPYESLMLLDPVMKLVDPEVLAAKAEDLGLVRRKSFTVGLPRGKEFQVIYFVKKYD